MQMRFAPLFMAALLLAAPAQAQLVAAQPAKKDAPKAPAQAAESWDAQDDLDADPLRGYNRAMFQVNRALDTVVLKPVAQGYRFVVPEKGRTMVSNAVANIYSPVVFGNSLLQGDVHNSFATFWRFFLNSTFGIGGLFDVASEAGLKNRTTDLGQTFAIYGAGPGAYVVLPLIGPSNVRDALGRVGDMFMNPVMYMDDGVAIAVAATTAVDMRSNNMKLIDDIYATSVDPYVTFKSGYTQKRAADVNRARIERQKSLEKAGFQ